MGGRRNLGQISDFSLPPQESPLPLVTLGVNVGQLELNWIVKSVKFRLEAREISESILAIARNLRYAFGGSTLGRVLEIRVWVLKNGGKTYDLLWGGLINIKMLHSSHWQSVIGISARFLWATWLMKKVRLIASCSNVGHDWGDIADLSLICNRQPANSLLHRGTRSSC